MKIVIRITPRCNWCTAPMDLEDISTALYCDEYVWLHFVCTDPECPENKWAARAFITDEVITTPLPQDRYRRHYSD